MRHYPLEWIVPLMKVPVFIMCWYFYFMIWECHSIWDLKIVHCWWKFSTHLLRLYLGYVHLKSYWRIVRCIVISPRYAARGRDFMCRLKSVYKGRFFIANLPSLSYKTIKTTTTNRNRNMYIKNTCYLSSSSPIHEGDRWKWLYS